MYEKLERYEMLKDKLEQLYKIAIDEKQLSVALAIVQEMAKTKFVEADAPKVQEEPTADKPETETAKQKKARIAKEKKAAVAAKNAVTAESAKALAKKIALASDDPKECMNQIRETVSEVSELCYENANVGIDKFDATGLILLQEELTKFVYTQPGDKEETAAADDLAI